MREHTNLINTIRIPKDMSSLKQILPKPQYDSEDEDETLTRDDKDYNADYPVYTHRDQKETGLVSHKHTKNPSKLKSTRVSLQHDLEDYKEQMKSL